MKRLKLFFACLLMAVLSIGQMWGATTYTKVTEVSSLSNGDKVVIAMGDASPATGVKGGTVQSSTSTKKDAVVSTTASEWIQFTVSTTTDGWYLTDGTNFIGKPTANTFYLTTTEASKGVCSVNSDGVLTCNSRYLTQNGTNYRMYTSIGSYSPFYVWKVTTGGDPDPVLQSIAVSGDPSTTTYEEGNVFDVTGLVVTGTYDIGDPAAITEGITWEVRTNSTSDAVALANYTLTQGQTSLQVRATVSDKTSEWYDVTGLTVTAVPSYELVKNAANLAIGDKIIITNLDANQAISTNQASNNRTGVSVTASNDVITPGNNVQVLTLGEANDHWTLSTGSGYLYAANSSSNHMKTQEENDANGEWTISIASDGTATIIAQGSYTHNEMRYNPNSGSPVFSCYASTSSMAKVMIFKKAAAPSSVATPTISGDNQFMTSTSVTMSCETDGADIYYTTKESAKNDKATDGDWKAYDNPTFTSTTTVWAAAKKGDDWSNIASATFTKLPHYDNIQAMYTAADAETDVYVTFGNWVVSGVSTNGKNVYVTDNTNGFIIYNNDGGLENHFAVGKVLSGTAKCKMLKFNGALELKELNSETAGLNIATGGTISENQTALASLSGVNTGSLISISDACTNPSGSIFKVGDFQLYNSLYAFANPTAGSNYNVKGIFVQYGETKEICPRSAEDIVEQQEKQNANTQWVAASKTARIGDATTNWWSTESDGAKSFISTNEAVATIDAEGAITLVAPGTTTLKFSTAATDTYFAGPEVSMVLTVKAALPAGGVEFTWDATAQSYTDQAVMETVTAAPNPIIAFANTGSTDPKWFDNGSAVRFYKDNSITITAPEGNLLYEININFVSGYTKTITTDVVTYNLAGTVGTWSGLAKEVIFSNGDGAARLTSINVIYAPGTVTELAIADINLKTTDGETALGITKNVDATIMYEGLDESVATISANKVTPVGKGSTTVTARIEQGSNYTAAETTFTITVAAKTIPALSFPQASYDANLGESFEAPALTNLEGVTVLYSSDNAAVSVDENTGAITLNAEGTAVITATSVETTDYAVNTASYTLNVIDPYKDVITAAGIGLTSYTDWSKSFTSTTVYAGNSTANNGDIQLRKSTGAQDKSGIITTSVAGYLKYLYASAGNNENATGHYLNVYAKNTAYVSVADLYDDAKCGTLIGTISEDGGEIDFVDDKDYVDNYKYIALKSNNGAAYYGEIIIKWTPATFNTYTVTYEPGEATGEDVVIDNIEEGTEITLAADDTYSKEGYTFMGWSDGVNTYAAGAKYEVNSDVTFTAQWAQNFTVTYKAGEAGETQVVRTVPAGAYNLESCSFAYANHAFDGWQNGSNKYNAGAAITISEDMEFVATWVTALAPVTVTFNVNTLKSDKKALYKEGVNVSVTDGTFNNENNYRCYANKDMTISTELGYITNIVINSVTGNTAEAFSLVGDNGNYAYETLIGTWSGSSASIQLHASSQVRMTQIQVTYIPSAYLRNVNAANNFGTLCLPFNGTIEGAELLEFVDKDADNVYLGDADAAVLAGKPYIFRSTAAQIKVSFTDNNFVDATDNNGLHGTYVRMENDELNGTCLISNNKYYNINTDDCSLNAYRAYFMLSEVPSIGGNLARRRYAIGNGAPQVATDINALNASETPVKMIINGQLYILRGEKMYDATGKLVK